MEFAGTNGKWYVDGVKWFTIQSKQDKKERCLITYPTIATVNSYTGSEIESKANALLISKAPEMLEMLQSIVAYGGIANWDKIKQLIKEATEL